MKRISSTILWLLAIFSLCILILRWFGIIPTIWGQEDNVEARNEVLLNLSYSYLAGCIFYLLVTWYPNRLRSKRMRPFIDDKKKVIKGKFENCAEGIIPTEMLLNHKPTKEELLNHLSENSLLSSPTFFSLMGKDINIHTYWRIQREEIKEHIHVLLEFRDYLTDQELKVLGDLQNCQFFYLLNGVFQITDKPEVRVSIGEELWNAIRMARQL